MTHASLLAGVKKYLNQLGVYVFKYHGTNFTSRGVPDLICCYQGKFIAIELKSGKDKLTELQKHNLDLIQQSGGVAFTARSLDDVKKVFNDIF